MLSCMGLRVHLHLHHHSCSASYITHIVRLYVGLVCTITFLFYIIHYPHCTTVRGTGVYIYILFNHNFTAHASIHVIHHPHCTPVLGTDIYDYILVLHNTLPTLYYCTWDWYIHLHFILHNTFPNCTTVHGADIYVYAILGHTLMSESTSYITHIVPLYVGLVYTITLLFYVIHYPHCTTVRGTDVYAYAFLGHMLLHEIT